MDYFDMLADRDYYPIGDPRRCRAHPHVTTSSADGLHDAPCGHCEHEGYLAEMAEMYGDEPAPVVPSPVPPVYVPTWDDCPF